MSKRAKIMIWSIASAGVLLVMAVLLVAGGYANGFVREGLQCVLSRYLDEVCQIDEIQGNPLGDCRVVGVQIGNWARGDTLDVDVQIGDGAHVDTPDVDVQIGNRARVDTLDVEYNFWSLLTGKVVVHRLRLSGVELRIDASRESAEAIWWDVPPPVDLDIASLEIVDDMASLEIVDANVVVDSTNIRNLDLKGAFSAGESGYRLVLARFRSVQFDPPLAVTNLSGIAVLQTGDLALDDVELSTRGSGVSLHGTVQQLNDPKLALDDVELSTRGSGVSLHGTVQQLNDPKLDLDDVELSTRGSGVSLHGTVQQLNDPKLDLDDVELSTRGSGVSLHGTVQQLNDPKLDLVVKADSLWLPDIKRLGERLADIKWLGDMPARAVQMRGSVKGKMQSLVTELAVKGKGDSAQVTFKGKMELAPFALRGDVDFEIEMDDLSVWGIPLEYTVGFDLKGMGKIKVDSSGVQVDTTKCVFRQVQVGKAQFDSVRFDSLRFDSDLKNGLLRAQVFADGASGKIKGNLDLSGLNTIEFNSSDVGGIFQRVQSGTARIEFYDLHAGHFPGVPEKVQRVTGYMDFKREDAWRVDAVLEKLQTAWGEILDVNAQARYADQQLSIDHFELDLPNWGTHVNGNGRLHFEGEKPAVAGHVQAKVELPHLIGKDQLGTSMTLAGPVDGVWGGDLTVALSGDVAGNVVDSVRVSARIDSTWRGIKGNVKGEVALPQVTGTDKWGDALKLVGNVKGIMGVGLTAILKGDIEGNDAIDRFQVSALIDSTRVTDIRADLSGKGGVFSARGHFGRYFKARWHADVKQLATVGKVVGVDLSGDLKLSGALWGLRNAHNGSRNTLNISAQASTDSLVIENMPISLPRDLMLLGALSDTLGQNGKLNILLSGYLGRLGDLSGKAWPVFSARGGVNYIGVDGIPIQKVDLKTHWVRPDSGDVTLEMDRVTFLGERALQAVRLKAEHTRGKTSFELSSNADVQDWVMLRGHVLKDKDTWQVAMDSLHIQVDKIVLDNKGPVELAYYRGFQIDSLVISGPTGHPVLKKLNPQTVKMQLTDIRPWVSITGFPYYVDGSLKGKMVFPAIDTLTDTLTDTLVSGTFQLTDGKIRNVKFGRATGEGAWENGRVHFAVKVMPDKDEVLKLNGSYLTNTDDIDSLEVLELNGSYLTDTDDIDSLHVKSKGIMLLRRYDSEDEKTKLAGIKRFEALTLNTALNEHFKAGEGISGLLSMDLKVRGGFEQPDIQGKIEFKNGDFIPPGLNRSFAPVSFKAAFENNKIEIDSLKVGTSASLSGDVTLNDFSLSEWNLSASEWNLSARFREFEPIAWPELQLKVDGDLMITGNPQNSKVKGELMMKEAEIRLAELLEMPSQEMPDFLETVAVDSLKLSADRRVWVRDPTFEMEIVGDLTVEKESHSENLHIHGTMASRRGNYILQNRRMRITQSEIRFQNYPRENPTLDIRAETSVRGVIAEGGEAEPVAISVTVGGTMTHPDVLITSDPPVGEGREDIEDIVSLMVTGRSVGQYQFSREGTLYPVLGIAANRLGQYIGQKLRLDLRGQKLRLDLVEIDVGEGDISRFQLGTYIGHRLFISYARDFANTAHEVSMEFWMKDTENQQKRESVGLSLQKEARQSIGLFWKKEW